MELPPRWLWCGVSGVCCPVPVRCPVMIGRRPEEVLLFLFLISHFKNTSRSAGCTAALHSLTHSLTQLASLPAVGLTLLHHKGAAADAAMSAVPSSCPLLSPLLDPHCPPAPPAPPLPPRPKPLQQQWRAESPGACRPAPSACPPR